MLHCNSLVKDVSDNVYYEVSLAKLDAFKLTETVADELKNREKDGKVKFMAYNDNFIERFNMLRKNRHIVHVHMTLNAVLLVLLQVFLYELICFSMISPIQAFKNCPL